jgi:hypothetical protein
MFARFLAAVAWVYLAWGGALYCQHHPGLTVPWLILLIVYILALAASLNWLDPGDAEHESFKGLEGPALRAPWAGLEVEAHRVGRTHRPLSRHGHVRGPVATCSRRPGRERLVGRCLQPVGYGARRVPPMRIGC